MSTPGALTLPTEATGVVGTPPMSPIEVAGSPLACEMQDGQVVRMHLDPESNLVAHADQSEPSNHPVMPKTTVGEGGGATPATGPRSFGEATDANLGPAPGPTVTSPATSSPIINNAAAASATETPIAAAAAATVAPSQPAGPTTPNPHSGALSAVLLDALRMIQSSGSPASSSSLSSTLDQIDALDFHTKTKFFTLLTAESPTSEAALHAMMEYFLDDEHSGSSVDFVCKFLYDTYWEASSKLAAASAAASSLAALPAQHLFVLNLLPLMVYKFLTKQSTSSGSGGYAGLFTVFLAIYNTERVISARAPGKSILSRPPLPNLPELAGLPPIDLAGQKHATAGAMVSLELLPAIVEPAQHTDVLLHVLLKRFTLHFKHLLAHARQSAVYAVGLVASSGQPGDVFADVLTSGAQVGPPTVGKSKWSVHWPIDWRRPGAPPARRFVLSTDLLQAGLVALTYQLEHAAKEGPQREFVLAALRQVHCRAIEDLRPQLLLQTTVLLEFEEQAKEQRMARA